MHLGSGSYIIAWARTHWRHVFTSYRNCRQSGTSLSYRILARKKEILGYRLPPTAETTLYMYKQI